LKRILSHPIFLFPAFSFCSSNFFKSKIKSNLPLSLLNFAFYPIAVNLIEIHFSLPPLEEHQKQTNSKNLKRERRGGVKFKMKK
jgi:hypothetical protein